MNLFCLLILNTSLMLFSEQQKLLNKFTIRRSIASYFKVVIT